MMTFENQERINNNKAVHLAALAQTAIHGWHGNYVNDDCTARDIADAIGVDFVFTYKWYHEHTYDVPDIVIEKLKEAAANHSIHDLLKIHPTDLCYPPKWLVAKFN
jgi:uncharacterized protein YjlB